MIVHTVSGSIYEVDLDSKSIRRMTGKGNPTPRQGADGQWRKYADLLPNIPVVDSQMLIVWDKDTPLLEGSEQGDLPTTMTSYVVAIDPVLS